MTPKEKAKELIDKYLDLDNYNNLNLDLFCDECGMSNTAAKICALIAVDEVLEIINNTMVIVDIECDYDYFQEVKQEIKLL